MAKIRYPLARPSITARERRAVLAVLGTDELAFGPRALAFERAFAKRIGRHYALAVSSGTAGLHLALLAAGIKPGDEVITSPFSFVASANAICYVGAKPVFADIDPVTYNFDPAKVGRAVTRRTTAILVVHIFGQPADMAPIMRLAKRHRLKIIEDACESLGATYRGRSAGTFGESAVFAFYPNKQITTGEGGMIVTDSPRVAELCRSLRNQGRAEDRRWLDHVRLGYNYRMDEMSAALGLVQLSRLGILVRKRRRVALWYQKYLGHHPEFLATPRIAPGSTHTWFVYVVLLRPGADRDVVIHQLARAGIEAKAYLPSIHLFGFYRKRFGCRPGDFPVSEAVSARSLALPFHPGLPESDVRAIGDTLIRILRSNEQ